MDQCIIYQPLNLSGICSEKIPVLGALHASSELGNKAIDLGDEQK